MLFIIRSGVIPSDSRVLKYISFLKERNIPYYAIGWNRLNDNLGSEERVFYYTRKSGYRVGGFKAAKDRFFWMQFIFRYLLKKKKDVTTIHACDIDCAFPASLYKLIHRNAKVVFDVFDWYSADIKGNFIIKRVFKFMEWFAIKMSDEVIICEPERIDQIPYKLNKKELVLPNIPSFANSSFLNKDLELQFNSDLLTFSYVGWFSNDRCLKELLRLVEDNRINLLIAGYGIDEIEKECFELNKRKDNIKYFGKVPYEKGLNIMYNSDIIYAMYQKINQNNIYCAPNKYYESMFLGKPIFSTKGTIMESKIVDNAIGYVSEEDYNDILNVINGIGKEDIITKGKLAHTLWTNLYSSYVHDFMEKKYSVILQ